jgi:anaerobic magnesium-protoporphyrin IX monomethyl ester cyclase
MSFGSNSITPPSTDPKGSLAGLKILFVFHSFKNDTDTLAFIKNVRHLGVVPPLNLLYLSAWLRQFGVETELLDCSALNLDYQSAVEAARSKEFDLLCFTTTNLDFLFVIEWIRAFSKAFKKPILVGGPGAENYPSEMAWHPEIQTVFHGPAETSIIPYLEAWTQGKQWWTTPGSATVYDGKLYLNSATPLAKDFARPHPDRSILNIQQYYSILSKGFPFTAGMSSFGCPFGCHFCQIRLTPFFIRTAQDLISELEICEKEYGIEEIDYFDSNFTIPKERVFQFADLYKERGLKIRWSCRARSDQINDEMLEVMARANCAWIGYGIESGDDSVLKKIHKTQKGSTHIRQVIRKTKAAGIGVTGFFVLGLPGETQESLKNTLDLITTEPLDYAQISPYWPIPKTPIYESLVQETGVDVWKLAITDGTRQGDLSLKDTPFSVKEMHQYASKIYQEFYFRPSQILQMTKNLTSYAQFKNFLNAGVDVLKGVVLGE